MAKEAHWSEFKVDLKYLNLMDRPETEDYENLRASVKVHGVQDPIEVSDSMVIIDGHSRHSIVEDLDGKLPYFVNTKFDKMSEPEQKLYIVNRNFVRRHMGKFKKCMWSVDRAVEWGWFDEAQQKMLAGKRASRLHFGDDPFKGTYEGGDTRDRIVRVFNVSRNGVQLYINIRKYELWPLLDKVLSGDLTIHQATKKIQALQKGVEEGEEKEKVKAPKNERILDIGRFKDFEMSFARLGQSIWSPKSGDKVRISWSYIKTTEKEEKGKQEKPWKSNPFKDVACIHGVVGGCRECYKDPDNPDHGRKTPVISQDSISIPVDKSELDGFRILPDRELGPCRKCEKYDAVNEVCKLDLETDEVPKECRKFRKDIKEDQ